MLSLADLYVNVFTESDSNFSGQFNKKSSQFWQDYKNRTNLQNKFCIELEGQNHSQNWKTW